MFKGLLSHLCLLLLICCVSSTKESHSLLVKRVNEYLSDVQRSQHLLQAFVESGSMDGMFTTEEVNIIFETLQEKYPQFVSKEIIGKTVKGKDIPAYTLSSTNLEKKYKKSKVLFTGAHHARELLTPTIILRIYIEALHSLIHPSKSMEYWRYNDLLIIPIVNLDSHAKISASWNTGRWDTDKWIRKNQQQGCKTESHTGVDLNRNYGFHYGETTEDLDPCSETFRGQTAFSEPETQAVRSFVEKHTGMISSAMNFHSYGNMWLRPFNYMRVKDTWPDRFDQTIINFYKNFDQKIKPVTTGLVGNAIESVGYFTDGEASDWMLGDHQIFSFSPELGSKNPAANTFFIPKNLIFSVILENYSVIDLFLKENTFRPSEHVYGFNSQNLFHFSFTNEGIATLYQPTFTFITGSTDFTSGLKSISGKSREGNIFDIPFKVDFDKIIFSVPEINRLTEFSLDLEFLDKSVMNSKFSLDLQISLSWGEKVASFKIYYDGRQINEWVVYTAIIIAILFMIITSIFIIEQIARNRNSNKKKKNLSSSKNPNHISVIFTADSDGDKEK